MSWTSATAAAEARAAPAPDAAGHWPAARSPTLDWLVGEARLLPNGRSLLRALCERLVAAGLPLARASFHIRILHPQLFGMGYYWQRGSDEIRVFRAEHGIQETSLYQQSPMRILFEGAGAVRQRLDLPDVAFRFPLFYELRAEGLTDYVALPVTFSDGKIHGTTWSSDRPGGFSSSDLAQIYDLLPAFSLLLEIYLNRRIAITLLDTYVGHAAGERILRGQITRGSGETVRAAIWFCDLRGFTALAERLDRDRLLACLNEYFDRMAKPVEDHGGEILKFIGDAMLAMFPLDTERRLPARPAGGARCPGGDGGAEPGAPGAGRRSARVRHRAPHRRRDVRQHRHRRPARLHRDRARGQSHLPPRGAVSRARARSSGVRHLRRHVRVRRLSLARDPRSARDLAAGRGVHRARSGMTPLQRLARRLGYDLTPRRKAKAPHAQLVAVLEHFRITCVLDVGANVGQYGALLREWGYPRPDRLVRAAGRARTPRSSAAPPPTRPGRWRRASRSARATARSSSRSRPSRT